jgi:hypothetical protein
MWQNEILPKTKKKKKKQEQRKRGIIRPSISVQNNKSIPLRSEFEL